MSAVETPSEMLNLDDLVVMVTGAGGGIGRGIVDRYATAGASVVAHTRSSAVQIPQGGKVVEAVGDLTDPGTPERLVAAAIDTFGRLDVVVNSAGIQPLSEMIDVQPGDWQRMIDTNLTAAHLMSQAVARHLVERGAGGSIVHIASIEGHHPAPMHGHYATAKAALIMHARAAALEFGPYGIRVNSVSPGLIDRPGLASDWPEGVSRWEKAAPLARLGTPRDVADACLFLTSPLARWITGIDLVVDGGVLAGPTW